LNSTLAELAASPRVTVRRKGEPDTNGRCVVYWMQRAQRTLDNPALDVAVEAANALKLPAIVFFAPVPFYPHANLRHYKFLEQGIPDIARGCAERNIAFVLRRYPDHSLLTFCDQVKPALVIGDENPMREPRAWRETAAKKLKVPLWTVDADVIVPSKLLEKEQYAARTIRPRLNAQLKRFLVPQSNVRAKVSADLPSYIQSLPLNTDITKGWDIDRSVQPVVSFVGGTSEARCLLDEFVGSKLKRYPEKHGKPDVDGTSRISPYLHFGHISPITVALAVEHADVPRATKDAYLDELLVWRELAINFVTFNPLYDSIECAPDWAHKTLAEHARDKRPILYTREQLEFAQTHDELWNAAQLQMLYAGWMHNYMRMYWAKKILEWSKSPAVAYQAAVYLNDKYFLDGRDPNGYAGIAWTIAGKFDRPWFDRPIFGTIRYMSAAASAKKFDSQKYIQQMNELAGKASTAQPALF